MTDLTIGQKRAAHSLAAIKGLKGLESDQIEVYVQQFASLEWLFKQHNLDIGKFDSYVERLPATIVTNGLGQAMAFELAASKLGKTDRKPDERAHELLYRIIESWLQERRFCQKGMDLMKSRHKRTCFETAEKQLLSKAILLIQLIWLILFQPCPSPLE